MNEKYWEDTRAGQEYRWKRHDSLTVRGNKWYRHSQSKGGAPIEAHSNKNRSYVSLDLDNAKEIIGEKVIETIDKTKEKIENFNVSEKLDKAKEIIEEMTQPAAEPESSKEEPAPEKNEEEKNADNSSSISIAYADDDDEASSEEFFDDEDEESEDKPEA